jgi:hypothetical protein
MKARNGFVSNSSTTSFMVAVKDIKDAKVKIEGNIEDFAKYKITTVDELNEYFKKEYSWVDLKAIMGRGYGYDEAKKAIEGGKILLAGNFSSESDGLEVYLHGEGIRSVVDSDKVDVLLGE